MGSRSIVSYDDITLPYDAPQSKPQPPPKKRRRNNNNNKKVPQHWDDPAPAEDEAMDGEESRELTQEEIWDDSALIDAWNAAMEEYEAFHGPDKGWKKEPVHKSPLSVLSSFLLFPRFTFLIDGTIYHPKLRPSLLLVLEFQKKPPTMNQTQNPSTLIHLFLHTTQVSQFQQRLLPQTLKLPIQCLSHISLMSLRMKLLNMQCKLVIGLATGQPFIMYVPRSFHSSSPCLHLLQTLRQNRTDKAETETEQDGDDEDEDDEDFVSTQR